MQLIQNLQPATCNLQLATCNLFIPLRVESPFLVNSLIRMRTEVVELKAWKLYINSFRDKYISHEESVNQILDDLVAECDPLSMTIKGDFSPRGNVSTIITVHHKKEA